MSSRRRLLLVLAAVLVSLAGGKLARRALVKDASRPRTVHELAQLLQHSGPPLHVVPISDLGEEAGVYLCVKPQEREALQWLIRDPAFAHKWKGVVYCTRDGGGSPVPPDEMNSWGEYGLRLGDLLLFGDPALLDRIHKRAHQGQPTG